MLGFVRVLREYERAVIVPVSAGCSTHRAVLGSSGRSRSSTSMVKVDLRTITLNVPPQEVITKDNVPVRVNAVAYFKIVDPKNAIVQVENYMSATSQISQTTLRSVLGQHVLDELLSEREKINEILQSIIDEATGPWGIKVTIVEVKDVEIPTGMREAMARQAEAERERRAKIISAEGEFQAAERLKDAAIVLEEPGRAAAALPADADRGRAAHQYDDDRLPRPDRHHPAVPLERAEKNSESEQRRAARSASRRAARTPGEHPRGRAGSRAHAAAPARLRCRRRSCRRPSPPRRIDLQAGRGRRGRSTRAASCGRGGRRLMPASTSSPWWRGELAHVRAEFGTRPDAGGRPTGARRVRPARRRRAQKFSCRSHRA